jgi:hypothetical protein
MTVPELFSKTIPNGPRPRRFRVTMSSLYDMEALDYSTSFKSVPLASQASNVDFVNVDNQGTMGPYELIVTSRRLLSSRATAEPGPLNCLP